MRIDSRSPCPYIGPAWAEVRARQKLSTGQILANWRTIRAELYARGLHRHHIRRNRLDNPFMDPAAREAIIADLALDRVSRRDRSRRTKFTHLPKVERTLQ